MGGRAVNVDTLHIAHLRIRQESRGLHGSAHDFAVWTMRSRETRNTCRSARLRRSRRRRKKPNLRLQRRQTATDCVTVWLAVFAARAPPLYEREQTDAAAAIAAAAALHRDGGQEERCDDRGETGGTVAPRCVAPHARTRSRSQSYLVRDRRISDRARASHSAHSCVLDVVSRGSPHHRASRGFSSPE